MTLSGADTILSGLNREQVAAVTAPVGPPILVLAGAGCGKTTVLTRRIAYLAQTFCPCHTILALTFTRAAAREMAQRAGIFSADGGNAGPPLIATFHAFCLRFLFHAYNGAPSYELLGYRKRPRLVSNESRLRMIADASTREERRVLCLDVMELSALLGRKAVLGGCAGERPQAHETILLDIERRYSKAKKNLGLWDFSDFISGALELFNACPEVALGFASRFRAVLVDEFQDTNPSQIRLLGKLLSGGIPLFAVGDDDQAIFGFQGADRSVIADFASRFPGAHILKLQTNYRSTPAILSAANRIFASKPREFRKILVAGGDTAGGRVLRRAVIKKAFESDEDMVDWLALRMQRLAAEHAVPLCGCAVLFRLNQTLDRIAPMLSAALANSGRPPQFLTVHGSKGREFDAVFVCDLEEGVFPKKQLYAGRPSLKRRIMDLLSIANDDDGDGEEERRLFYVGVTRARRFLCLCSVRRKMLYGRTRTCECSKFVRLVR